MDIKKLSHFVKYVTQIIAYVAQIVGYGTKTSKLNQSIFVNLVKD